MFRAYDNSTLFKEKIYVALLTSIQVFNILDFVIILPMGPMLMRYFEITPLQFATLASSYNISSAALSFFYSSFADKFDRKKLLLVALFGFILSTFFCAIAPNYFTFLSARIIAGIFGGILTPCTYAIVTELIPFERRGRALGTIMASFSLTSVLGVPVGLFIANHFGWRHSFHFIGASSTIVFICNYFILPLIPKVNKSFAPIEVLKRMFSIMTNKEYLIGFLTITCFSFSGFLIFPFFSTYSVLNVGILETDLTYIYLFGGLFTVVSSKFAGKYTDQFGSMAVYYPTLMGSILFTFLFTHAGHLNLVTLLIISTGFMMLVNARLVPVMKLLTEIPKIDDRGSFMGILMSVRSLGAAGATFIAGFIIKEVDKKFVNFDLVGMLSIAISLISILFVLKINKNIIAGARNASRT